MNLAIQLPLLISILVAAAPVNAQGALDAELRRSTAERIHRAYGISFDWRNATLVQLTDAEARIGTAARIKRMYGWSLDWEKATLIELTDAEARIGTARRVAEATGTPVDWRSHSLHSLLEMERKLGAARPVRNQPTLSFDVLFPPESQRAIGIHKLSDSERLTLHHRVEELIRVALRNSSDKPARRPEPAPSSAPRPSGGAIESSIDGEFEGWDGDTVVRLMNGQIWQLELIRFRGQFHAASTAPSYSASYRAGAT